MRKDPDEMGVLQVKTTAPKQYAPSRLKPEIGLLMDDIDTVSVRTQEESSLERRLRLLVRSIYRGARCICLDADHLVVLSSSHESRTSFGCKVQRQVPRPICCGYPLTRSSQTSTKLCVLQSPSSFAATLTQDSGSMLARLRNPLSKRRRVRVVYLPPRSIGCKQQHP